MRKLVALLPLLFPSLALACWQTELPHATLDGSSIRAQVLKSRRPLKHASVRIYIANTLLTRTSTDSTGVFTFSQLPPAKYRVVIANWGSANVEMKQPLLYSTKGVLLQESVADGCLFARVPTAP